MKYMLLIAVLFPVVLNAQSVKPVTRDINASSYKTIALPERPDFLTTDQDNAWVIDDKGNRIQKISISHSNPLLTVTIPGACAAPVAGFNAVWVMSCSEKTLYKINRNTGAIIKKIYTGVADSNGEMSLASGDGSVWLLSDSTGILSRINPNSNKIEASIRVKPHSYCAGFGYHAVWITNTDSNSVQRIDVKTNSVVSTIMVGKRPRFLSVGANSVWTLNQGDGTVSKIDPYSNKMIATIDADAKGGGGDIAAGSSKVWIVSTNTKRPVQTINTKTNQVEKIYTQNSSNEKDMRVDGAVRVSKKYIWVTGLYRKAVWVFKK